MTLPAFVAHATKAGRLVGDRMPDAPPSSFRLPPVGRPTRRTGKVLRDLLPPEDGTPTSEADDERLDALVKECDDLVALHSTSEEQREGSLSQVLQRVMALHEFLETRPDSADRLLQSRGVKRAKAGANPFVTVIKVVFGGKDRSNNTRYAAALRFAAEHHVNSTGLPEFLKANGGVVGCQRLDRKAHATAAKRKADQDFESALEIHRAFGSILTKAALKKIVAAPFVSLLVEPLDDGSIRILGVRDEERPALARYRHPEA